jgi:tetratricopeptide (TPR) repeat protein
LNSVKINRKQIIHNLFPSFFTEKEIKECGNSGSVELSSFTSAGNETPAKIKNQITLEENNNADFYNNRGNEKYFLEDYKGAIQDCDKAIKQNPNYAGAYKLRGMANRKLKNNDSAIRDYCKAIELNPNDPQAYIFCGDAKIALGDIHGGCLDLDKAGELCSAQV